ncbi:MAG: hypothetical protein GTO41_07580, partial [Burkholderiales bacterium]|nr:hypothetical protein [Burkholderiales bacterium]
MSEQASGYVERFDWDTACELPSYVFEALEKPNKAINPIAILATVDKDGAPRTAPFGSLRAVTPRLLRLISLRYHDTYVNLCRDGRVSVSLVAPPDISVSIFGVARVAREKMQTAEQYAILEIDVQNVKNDMVRTGVIDSATRFAVCEQHWPWFDA